MQRCGSAAGPAVAYLANCAKGVRQGGHAVLMNGLAVGAHQMIDLAQGHAAFEGLADMGEQNGAPVAQERLQDDRDRHAECQNEGRGIGLIRKNAIVGLQQCERKGQGKKVGTNRCGRA